MFVASWVNPDEQLAQQDLRRLHARGHLRRRSTRSSRRPASAGERDRLLHRRHAAARRPWPTWRAQATTSAIASPPSSPPSTISPRPATCCVFTDEERLTALKQQMDEAAACSTAPRWPTTFNMLRANDLIWSFVVNNYLLGKEPRPFDLLYWNSDTTRMPEALHMLLPAQVLRENALVRGRTDARRRAARPRARSRSRSTSRPAKEDHIAPGPLGLQGAQSIRRAGDLHPGGLGPYRRRGQSAARQEIPALDERAGNPPTLAEWQTGAVEHPGSWWTDWDKWLSAKSGGQGARTRPRRRRPARRSRMRREATSK